MLYLKVSLLRVKGIQNYCLFNQ